MRRLSAFARVVVLDRRGLGLSDPVDAPPSVEERIDDIRAVMGAAGCERAALLGASECLASYFAATYPDRVSATVQYGALVRFVPSEDFPWAVIDEAIYEEWVEAVREAWGEGLVLTALAPSKLADERGREWWGRYERACVSPSMQLRMMEANRDLDS